MYMKIDNMKKTKIGNYGAYERDEYYKGLSNNYNTCWDKNR